MREHLTTHHKALKINLDPFFYGTFAEIGAGQEVVRHFFKVGGASGTIAKAMSAYDMAFSDEIYGKEESNRYVSRSRLKQMLDHEWQLLKERLKGEKYEDRRFFVFANTVTTLNYNKNNEPHGWLGVRFQNKPGDTFNDVIIHVNLLDSDSSIQQSVLGELGVNLIYSCHQYHDNVNLFIDSLTDNLPKNSVEIDMLSMKGDDVNKIDYRLLSLFLVTKGLSKIACFLPDGRVIQPKDLLYKKNVALLRARYKPVTNLNIDMIENGLDTFSQEYSLKKDDVLMICEITLNNLTFSENTVNIQDFLDRAEILCKLGYTVMISNFSEHYELTKFLAKCKPSRIGIILGVMNLLQILNIEHYSNPVSDLMLQFGSLFSRETKLFAYPFKNRKTNKILNSKDIQFDEKTQILYDYLLANNLIVDITTYNEKCLDIHSTEIIENIIANKDGWEDDVPSQVADIIKEYCLFDYPCEIDKRRKKIEINLLSENSESES